MITLIVEILTYFVDDSGYDEIYYWTIKEKLFCSDILYIAGDSSMSICVKNLDYCDIFILSHVIIDLII